jgi:signal transduction histidine kinase
MPSCQTSRSRILQASMPASMPASTPASTPVGALSLSRGGGAAATAVLERDTRDSVIANVAHDLRSPLGAVYAALDFVLDTLLPPDEAHRLARKQLGIARSAAEQMFHLVTELLEGTTIDAGRLALCATPSDPLEMVRAAIDELDPFAARRGIALSCDLAPGLPLVLVDRPRIARVFSNLGANAIRFTPAGGGILFSAAPHGDAVRFSVTDTGSGIAPQHLPHIFDRFWRADQGSATGVGLGLAIAKSIVEGHRGQISVESKPGTGSTFSFTVPTAAAIEMTTFADGDQPAG